LTRLKALHIRVEQSDLWTNIELESLARKLNLAAYDVAYLDLTRRKKIPLATRDENLAKAATPEGIEILV
jgi:predicted nucleic acid-binding protein